MSSKAELMNLLNFFIGLGVGVLLSIACGWFKRYHKELLEIYCAPDSSFYKVFPFPFTQPTGRDDAAAKCLENLRGYIERNNRYRHEKRLYFSRKWQPKKLTAAEKEQFAKQFCEEIKKQSRF